MGLGGHIGHGVVSSSPPLRRFLGAVLSERSAAEMDPQLVARFGVDFADVIKI